jgi:predicted nucleic acid-binding protein
MTSDEIKAAFIDTNIWLYAFIESGEAEKSEAARALLNSTQPIISEQIINEICVNLIKKAGFSEDQIRQLIDAFYDKYRVVHLDQSILLDASRLRERLALSFWVSTVVACALSAQVDTLFTEDIQHRQIIEKRLQIVNPFVKTSLP